MGERIVSAEEARKLLDGIAATPWRVAPHDDPGAGEVQDADGYYVNAEGDADAQIMAAAPDLAATVIAMSGEIDSERMDNAHLSYSVLRLEAERDAYRAFALRIAALVAPLDAVDMAVTHLAPSDLDALAETVAATLENRAKSGRLAGLEEAAQVCEERMGDFANPAEIRARELSKTAAHIRSLAKATP